MSQAPGPAGVLVPQWTLVVIALGILTARLHLRINIKWDRIQLSDISMTIAWLLTVCVAAFDIRFAIIGALDGKVKTSGAGFTGPDEDLIEMFKLFWISGFPYLTALYFCKMTLLLLYVNVIPVFMRKRRYFLWSVMVFVNIAWILNLSSLIWPCLPVERQWALDPEHFCPPEAAGIALLVTWPSHFIGDVFIFILPWTVVPDLQLEWRMKMIVYATFALGLINIAFVIVRLVNLVNAAAEQDWRLALSSVELWSILDLNVSLCICGLPSLGAYFRKSGHGSSATQKRRDNNQPRSQHAGQLSGGRDPSSQELRNPAGSYNELDGGYNRNHKGGMFRKLKDMSGLSTFSMTVSSTISGGTVVGDGDRDGRGKKASVNRGAGSDSDVELMRVQTGSNGADRKGSDATKEDEVVVFQRPYYGRLDQSNNV